MSTYIYIYTIWCTTLTLTCREREKKIEELKQEKTKYEEGMWNVNAVLMGGLGKDPIIAEAQGLCHDVQKNLYVFNQRETDRQRENTFSLVHVYTNNLQTKIIYELTLCYIV